MKIDNKAWLTLYDSDYVEERYFYHFTNIDSAIKILNSRSLKFSKLNRTNDTLEAKPKININGLTEKNEIIALRKYITELNNNMLQLLCFTIDNPKRNVEVNDTTKYSDYSGRGFSSPRMWAQYATNNLGVCLVFNKEKLSKLIKDSLDIFLIHSGKITYFDQFNEFYLDAEISRRLLDRIRQNNNFLETNIFSLDFLRNNIDLVKYCYFAKLDDWKSENEYRFLAFGVNDFFIKDIDKALSGVIIGEKMTEENQKIVSFFCEYICEVKQITFTCNGCNLINIHDNF